MSELPFGWKMAKLRDLGQIDRGRSRHRPRYAEHLYGGPYPFIQTGDIKASGGRITEFSQTYSEDGLAQSRLWPIGTMCITIAANIAETGILTFPACFPDSVIGFIADETKCDVYFIEYMFRYLRKDIQRRASGSVQDNINLATLDNLYFPLPPLSEQKRIAEILGALDDKIELNRRMNRTLEAMARALFQSWFVDFDPVHAKARGETPYGMDDTTAALFPDSFEETAVGRVPRGWGIGKIIDICTTQYGYTASAVNENVGPKFLRITDMNKEPWINWDTVPHCEIDEALFPKYRLNIGDILVSRMADPGKAAIVDEAIDSVFASYLVRLKPLSSQYSYFLYYYLVSPQYLSYAQGAMSGSVQKGMNARVIADANLIIPSPEIANAFSHIVTLYRQKITKNLQESRTLTALRDTLLPKLVSGEVEIINQTIFL